MENAAPNWLPGRVDSHQAAKLLGFSSDHIPILLAKRLLKPLGHPPKNAPKYFARDYLAGLTRDQMWLAKASDALVNHWAHRNGKKGSGKGGAN